MCTNFWTFICLSCSGIQWVPFSLPYWLLLGNVWFWYVILLTRQIIRMCFRWKTKWYCLLPRHGWKSTFNGYHIIFWLVPKWKFSSCHFTILVSGHFTCTCNQFSTGEADNQVLLCIVNLCLFSLLLVLMYLLDVLTFLTSCGVIYSREFTHRVKSVSMSKFTTQEVQALEQGGNQVKQNP